MLSAGHDPLLPTSARAEDDSNQARRLRNALVRHLIALGDIRSDAVRTAMLHTPRHLFTPGTPLHLAYANTALRIGHGQTISQPSIVAAMSEALELHGDERVLEIGTGSGYQAAVLSRLAREVYTLEIVRPLAERARACLAHLGCTNVHARIGDGYAGLPEQAPFDRIILTAAPPDLPGALIDQLAPNGVLVAPLGSPDGAQWLIRLRKRRDSALIERLAPVQFVPMTPDDIPSIEPIKTA